MTLARVWRRQLLGASSAALMVPAAMFAALVVLALAGAFKSVGVLGQIFAGPPAPSVGASAAGDRGTADGAGAAAASLPVTAPVSGLGRAQLVTTRGVAAGGGGGGALPIATRSPSQTGSAINSSGGPVSGVSGGPSPPAPQPAAPAPSHPAATPPPPPRQPAPQPSVVDQVVKVITPVTSQLPAPAGPVATQAVEAAGSAADSLLPPAGSSLP